MVNIRTWCFLFVVYFAVQCDGRRYNKVANYYSNPPMMEGLRVPRGSNITLQCEADKCNSKYQIITWTFSGEKIPLNKNCVDLELMNVTINLSGIYVCSLNNVISHIYQVEVLEALQYDSVLPRVLSVTPANTTVPQYSNIVVRCRTGSSARVPPHVFWFKRTTSAAATVRDALTYGNHSYVRISDGNTGIGGGLAASPHSVPNERNVYLSKLSIQNATVKDSGVYACVAMTELGRDLQYFVVEVVTTTAPPRVTETLSLLFLIPITFALIPGIVWLCYSRCHHRKQIKAKCKLATSSPHPHHHRTPSRSHTPARQHFQHHRPRPDGDMMRMLRLGDGAPSVSTVASVPEGKRPLMMLQQTVSVV